MPEAESTSWLTVPEGLTQVIAHDGVIPRLLAMSALVLMETFLSRSRFALVSSVISDIHLLSKIPVKDTPSKRSSSVFFCHILRR